MTTSYALPDRRLAAKAMRPSKRLTAPASRVMALTMFDQAATSVSNFALSLVVAHYSHARAIGVFAIVESTYILSQGLVRSLSSDCLLTRSETDDGIMVRYESAGYIAALIASSAVAVCLLAVSPLLTSAFAVPMAIFALCFPFMAAQDFSRYIGISRLDPEYAIRLDIATLLLFVAEFVVLRATHHLSLPWLWGSWTVAYAMVGLTTMRRHLIVRGARHLLAFWVRSERAVALRFAGQFMLVTSWLYLIFYLIVFVLSISAVGAVKLAQLAIAPLVVVGAGLQAALTSIASKRFRSDRRHAMRFLFLAGVAMWSLIALWTLVAYLMPRHLGVIAFGPTWPKARVYLPYVGIGFAFSVFTGAANAGLRALRAAKVFLRLAVVMAPVFFLPTLGGAAVWGPLGFSIGLVVVMATYAALSWGVLVRIARRTNFGQLGGDEVETDAEVLEFPERESA